MNRVSECLSVLKVVSKIVMSIKNIDPFVLMTRFSQMAQRQGLIALLYMSFFVPFFSRTAEAQTSKAAASRPAIRLVSPAGRTAIGNAISITQEKATTGTSNAAGTVTSVK